MCGICGVYNAQSGEPVSSQLIERMTRLIAHRGPDDSGSYFDGPVGLGFARLSIIDLSGGHQPMCNENGDVWIVFNGEIWNYKTLRQELLEKGHHFRTHSDTEVVVHAWEEWGEDCLRRFRGMFAFALWDERQEILFLARDRLGKKPLYYARLDDGRVLFGSELKALLVCQRRGRADGRGHRSGQYLLDRLQAGGVR